MIRMNERDQVLTALRFSDTSVRAKDLQGDWRGVVVETSHGNSLANEQFEGTLIYFPGVTLKELQVP